MPDRPSNLPDTLEAARAAATGCTACDLYRDATQPVFGDGVAHAPLMLVGEQPGDKEDLVGHPFVGPAGQLLDRALADAGVDRGNAYVTNAVKHFKHVQRGKIRLHQKPNGSEISACRFWLDLERTLVKPKLVVALGATAAHSLMGKATTISKVRGEAFEMDDGSTLMVTVHPSYLLRLPDPEAKRTEYARFVDDLSLAREFLELV